MLQFPDYPLQLELTGYAAITKHKIYKVRKIKEVKLESFKEGAYCWTKMMVLQLRFDSTCIPF